MERRRVSFQPGRWDGGKVNDGVKPGVPIIHSQQRIYDVTVVCQVDGEEPGAALAVKVELKNFVSSFAEAGNDASAELSTGARNGQPHAGRFSGEVVFAGSASAR